MPSVLEKNVSLHINSVDELAVCHGLAVIHNMNYKTMREKNSQVSTGRVYKSYIDCVSFSSPCIAAFVAAGYRYLSVTEFGAVSVFSSYPFLCSWQHIEQLPVPDEYDYYQLKLESVVYQIA